MDALTMLREKLDGCSLYDLQQGTVVYAELAAYAAGLQMIYDRLEELERELFISTAEGRGLEVYEKMLGAYNTDSSLQGRRNSLISAFSITNSDHSRSGMALIPDIYNITGEFAMENGCPLWAAEAVYSFLRISVLSRSLLSHNYCCAERSKNYSYESDSRCCVACSRCCLVSVACCISGRLFCCILSRSFFL